MDNSNFGYDNEADELEDENNFLNPTGSYRDSIIFLVDCTKSMFAKQDEKDETLFQECMSAILSVYQSKIYSSDKDFLGLVFFGTEKNNTGDDFLHMNMIQDLDQPSAERIGQIEQFSQGLNMTKFANNYGHSDDFELDRVLWWCSNMFSNISQKLTSKRIFLFTRKSHPHPGNKTLEKLAKIKAKDLHDVEINTEIIPVVLKGEKFDYSKFYGDLLMLSDEEISMMPDPSESIEELKARFNIVRECTKPSKIKLDKKTNVETKSVTRRYAAETGEILFASDIKLGLEVADKMVSFEQDEMKSIKKFGPPGLKLLGFKPLDRLKPYMYIKPGSFLYPDEKLIEGSTTMFRALLEKCLAKEKFILCEMIPRNYSPPKMVALCPQQEELNELKIQVIPPGFHVIYLPFSEDFRENDKILEAKPTKEYVEVFEKCIQKLRFKFNPEDFRNPSIEKMWSEIEAIALEREQSQELIDTTLPDNQRIKDRAGAFLDEFSQLIGLNSTSAGNKRKTDSDSSKTAKKSKADEIDVEAEAKAGKFLARKMT